MREILNFFQVKTSTEISGTSEFKAMTVRTRSDDKAGRRVTGYFVDHAADKLVIVEKAGILTYGLQGGHLKLEKEQSLHMPT